MLSLNGKLALTGKWTLDPKNGPASIPNVPEVVVEVPSFTVTQNGGIFVPSSTSTTERLGRSLAISGNTLITGAANFSSNQGRAQLYEYNTTWTNTQTFTTTAPVNAFYGQSASLNGTWMGIGAYQESGTTFGFVNLHKKSTTWSNTPTQVLSPSVVSGDYFGYSQSMTTDTLAVGAYGAQIASQSVGKVYVYTLSADTWSLQATLDAGDTRAANARFGNAVSLDGDTLAVGAPLENSNAGAVYIFTRTGGTWTQRARLVPSSPIANSAFGVSLKLQGNKLIVGASGMINESNILGSSSAVYVFEGSDTSWTQKQVLTVSTTTGSTLVDANYGSGGLGHDVDLSSNGKVIIAGAPRATSNSKASGGAIYVFEEVNGVWGASAIANSSSSLRPSTAGNGTAAEYFGFQAKFHGSAIVGTVPYRNASAINTQRGGFFYFK